MCLLLPPQTHSSECLCCKVLEQREGSVNPSAQMFPQPTTGQRQPSCTMSPPWGEGSCEHPEAGGWQLL